MNLDTAIDLHTPGKNESRTIEAGGPGSGPQGGRGLSPELADLAKREGRKLRVMHPHQPGLAKISRTPKLSVPGKLYKGGPAPKVGPNPKLARPSAGGTGRAHGIRGGGPGSGRHPEGGTVKYHTPKQNGKHSAAIGALKKQGFTLEPGGIKDHGIGRYAQHTYSYQHPDGHSAVVSHSEAVGRDNFVKVESKDPAFQSRVGRAIRRSGY